MKNKRLYSKLRKIIVKFLRWFDKELTKAFDEIPSNNVLEFLRKRMAGGGWIGHEDFAVWLIQELNPSVIVDLGVGYGFSTLSFATPKIGKVYGIDWFKGDSFFGERNTYDSVLDSMQELKNRFGIDNIEIIKGEFSEVAKTWKLPIDILHIDGSHYYRDVKGDFENWSRFVREDGVILFHDVYDPNNGKCEGVGRFFDEINLPKFIFTHSFGLGIVSLNKDIMEKIKNYVEGKRR